MSVPSQLPPTHYELLGLTPEASPVDLRQAFRALSKRYHPDTTQLPTEQASEAFARLRQAYAVLADPASRRAYDTELLRRRAAFLARALPPAAPPGPLPPRATPIGVRRSLSGGEWFALLLLAVALVLSLLLGVGLAWARGMALITPPSWWEPSVAEVGAAPAAAAGVAPPSPGVTASAAAGTAASAVAEPPARLPPVEVRPGRAGGSPLPAPEPQAFRRSLPSSSSGPVMPAWIAA
ncbi:MAG: J domain-containing protein [Synechococcus sp.]|nr:J domain-containing protein [Synechococcus sp.]